MGKANRVDTTDRRVAHVVTIIGRNRARIDEIKETIRLLDAEQQPNLTWPPHPLNKQEKSIARSFGRALDRLQRQLRRKDVGLVLERALHGQNIEFFEWQAQLEHWRDRFEAFGGEAAANRNTLIEDGPTTWPLGRPKPSAAKYRRKHRAVAAAAATLESHGLPVTATNKSATRKPSVFCRVAAIYAGDPKIYWQCRAFIKARNRVSR
jgi:hypothetical protein